MIRNLLSLFGVLLSASLAAETILYVKPGATGSGASWDDAADLASAVATAAARETPCALYLAKGVYTASGLPVAPGTSVYGGFRGERADETPDGRDWTTDETIICGVRTAVWQDVTGAAVLRNGAQVRVLADDGTFVEPDPTEAERFWTPSTGTPAINASSVTGAGGTIVLDGLVFTATSVRFGTHAFAIRNCRFFGCWNDMGIVYGAGSFSVEDSSFDWCGGPAVSTDGAPQPKADTPDVVVRLRNVAVRHEVANNQRGLGVYAPNVALDVESCAFERNFNVRTLDNAGPAVLFGNGKSLLRIVGSRFVANHISTNANAIVRLPEYSSSVVSNCLFLANVVTGDRLANSSATACILSALRNDHVIWGCSFVSNVVDRWETETKAGVSKMPCAIVHSCYVAPIRNCTFDGNRVSAVASSPAVEPVQATLYSSEGNDTGCLFGNTFNGNEAATGDIVLDRSATQTPGAIRVYNSIFWSADAAYMPVARVGTGTISFHHCVVKGGLPEAEWIDGKTEAVSAGDPLLSGALSSIGGLLVRRPNAGAVSSARRKGVPLYSDVNGRLAVRDGAGHYIRCDTRDSSLLKEPYAAVPDVLGAFPREGRNPDIGAVLAAPSGGMVIVR